MDRLGERDQRLLGVGPRVEVHDGVLGHPPRHALGVRLRRAPLDPPVGQVGDVGAEVVAAGAAEPDRAGASGETDEGKSFAELPLEEQDRYFDRVKDGPLPFPDRDPSRMPLELDVKAGAPAP